MRLGLSMLCVVVAVVGVGGVGAARAAEGVLPIRAGDRVEGEVRWCGDRHILRLDLTRGERFRLRVNVAGPLLQDLTVRLYDPTGLEINGPARVRVVGGVTLAGPFRVQESGAHFVQITTFTRHEIPYEVTTRVRGRKRRGLRVPSSGNERSFVAAAGSVLRLSHVQADSSVSLRLPGGRVDTIEPGTPEMAALVGDGLTLPDGGTYAIAVATGRRAGRARIDAPRRRDARTLAFPELPDDRTAVAAWYDDSGWTRDSAATAAPDHAPPVSRPDAGAPPDTGSGEQPLSDAPTAPATPDGRTLLADPATPGGHAAGVGMPIAPRPTLAETLALGVVQPYADGPSYVFTADRPGLGSVTYRVQFIVGGRASLAPIVIDGLVATRWHVDGPGALHEEDWTLTHDRLRGVEVLQGSALRIVSGLTTVRSAAVGYTTPMDGGPPRGDLSWGTDSPVDGAFVRWEHHDGTGAVTVELR